LLPPSGDVPPAPSFEQDGLPAPPIDEPLSARNTKSGLHRLKVPPKLQPITWKSLYPGRNEAEPQTDSPSPLQDRFGHRLSPGVR
jgi:hypothetical protein